MNNQNALISTAMLTVIWEMENKDTLDLMCPFVTYSISETTSVGYLIDTMQVSQNISTNFGFSNIPNSVVEKSFGRLSKHGVLRKDNHKYYLKKDISEEKNRIESQKRESSEQVAKVVEQLTNYLNLNKSGVFQKDLKETDVKEYFVRFLEDNGYFVYSDSIGELRRELIENSAINYHIAQFILKEHKDNTTVFQYINNMAKGLLLSRVVYGYNDVQSDVGFKDLCVYLDTGLLLRILGYKSEEENVTARQMMDILREGGLKVKCFEHNYQEVNSVITSYMYNISHPEKGMARH